MEYPISSMHVDNRDSQIYNDMVCMTVILFHYLVFECLLFVCQIVKHDLSHQIDLATVRKCLVEGRRASSREELQADTHFRTMRRKRKLASEVLRTLVVTS